MYLKVVTVFVLNFPFSCLIKKTLHKLFVLFCEHSIVFSPLHSYTRPHVKWPSNYIPHLDKVV